jgi:hypothetical protein
MTISNYTNKTSYATNNSTTEFSFSFPVFASSEVTVVQRTDADGTDSTLTETTDYTVSLTGTGTPNYTGGSITTTSTIASGYTLFIYRVTTQTQDTDITNNDEFDEETIEARFDKLTTQIADLAEIVGRCIKVPIGDGTITVTVDNKIDRASTTLGFDADGNVETT